MFSNIGKGFKGISAFLNDEVRTHLFPCESPVTPTFTLSLPFTNLTSLMRKKTGRGLKSGECFTPDCVRNCMCSSVPLA